MWQILTSLFCLGLNSAFASFIIIIIIIIIIIADFFSFEKLELGLSQQIKMHVNS